MSKCSHRRTGQVGQLTGKIISLTCDCVHASLVEDAVEEFKTHDGEDNDEEHDQQHDVEQRDHGHHDGVDDNL